MDVISTGLGVLLAVVLLIVIGVVFFLSRMFRKVEQGKALIVSKVRRVDVTFTGAVVLPVLHKAETMDISVKASEIARTGREGLICRDNIRADIRITFFVRVNKTVEDVIKVAQAIGTTRASSESTLQELFNAKISTSARTSGSRSSYGSTRPSRTSSRWLRRSAPPVPAVSRRCRSCSTRSSPHPRGHPDHVLRTGQQDRRGRHQGGSGDRHHPCQQ